jgi:hypothetical protein
MKANPPKKSPPTVTKEPHELEHQIRLRAYELFEERGREDGHDIADWLQAETELTEKKVRSIAGARRIKFRPRPSGPFSCAPEILSHQFPESSSAMRLTEGFAEEQTYLKRAQSQVAPLCSEGRDEPSPQE